MSFIAKNFRLVENCPNGFPDKYEYSHPTDTYADIISEGYFPKLRVTNPSFVVVTAYIADGTYTLEVDGWVASVVGSGSLQNNAIFDKYLQNPIVAYEDQSAETIYWPYLVDLSEGGEEGWAIFWSTDHAESHLDSGIFMATAPTPYGPYTHHGRVFRDDTLGQQTETPSVIWDDKQSRWLMFYQQTGLGATTKGQQQTLVATASSVMTGGSPSTWTRQGVVLDIRSYEQPGNGHCGYMRLYNINGEWVALSLYGGTARSRYTLWMPDPVDLQSWTTSGYSIGFNAVSLAGLDGFDSDWRLANHQAASADGTLWVAVAGPTSAGGMIVEKRIVAFKWPEFKNATLVNDITPELQSWEGENGIESIGNVVNYGNKRLIVYRANGNAAGSGFGIAEIKL